MISSAVSLSTASAISLNLPDALAKTLTLPANPEEGVEPMTRRLVEIAKVKPTPPKYPRPSAKIAKQPL